jgi:hypothetical protein
VRATVSQLSLTCFHVALAACFLSAASAAAGTTQTQTPAITPAAQNSTKTPAAPAPSAASSANPPATAPRTTAPNSTTNPNSATTAAVDETASTQPASESATEKPKKVWTNEEVSGMTSTISVVGDGKNPKTKKTTQSPANPQYAAGIRQQLQKLQQQMADANKELATLKNFSDGEPVSTSDREFHKSYNSQPIAQQIANLQIKKKDLQSKIDTLLDEARKKGIEPGQLR